MEKSGGQVNEIKEVLPDPSGKPERHSLKLGGRTVHLYTLPSFHKKGEYVYSLDGMQYYSKKRIHEIIKRKYQ